MNTWLLWQCYCFAVVWDMYIAIHGVLVGSGCSYVTPSLVFGVPLLSLSPIVLYIHIYNVHCRMYTVHTRSQCTYIHVHVVVLDGNILFHIFIT